VVVDLSSRVVAVGSVESRPEGGGFTAGVCDDRSPVPGVSPGLDAFGGSDRLLVELAGVRVRFGVGGVQGGDELCGDVELVSVGDLRDGRANDRAQVAAARRRTALGRARLPTAVRYSWMALRIRVSTGPAAASGPSAVSVLVIC
jgi:hypothetical protein